MLVDYHIIIQLLLVNLLNVNLLRAEADPKVIAADGKYLDIF